MSDSCAQVGRTLSVAVSVMLVLTLPLAGSHRPRIAMSWELLLEIFEQSVDVAVVAVVVVPVVGLICNISILVICYH
jgi:hypothetical protein